MGVPVITLTGKTAVSRAGSSILHNAAMPQFVAGAPGEYQSLAVSLASNPNELGHIRSNLRRRMQSSPLCDAPGFARVFEQTLRGAWVTWCQSSPGS